MSALVVGYDGSECAGTAIGKAIDLARELDDELVIVFGYEPGGYGEEHTAHREAVREVGERLTAQALERAAEAGVAAEVALVDERPVDALVKIGRERDARAIVVGSYGESPLKGAILGSTPHKLLHLADRPVIVVPGGC
jgi:nucleotide-binding universal stress UspA family protein